MTRQEFNHQIAQYKYNVRSGSGIVTMNSGIKCYVPSVKFYGACAQDGTPTQDNPIPVTCNNGVWRLCGKNLFNDALLAEWGCNKTGSVWTVPDSNLLNGKTFYTNSNNDKSRVAIQYKINCLGKSSPFYLFVKYTDGNESIFRTDYSTELKYVSGVTTIDKTIDYISSTYGSRQNNFQIAGIQLEYGSAPTAYEPYHDGGTVDLSLLPDGGLYGIGDVRDEWDAATGKGVRRIGKVDLGNYDYTYTVIPGDRHRFVCDITNRALVANNLPLPAVCQNYKATTFEATWKHGDMASNQYNTTLISFINNDYSNAADFKAAMSGVYLYYELAEPVPFTATPQPIVEQNGYNQLLQESGDISNADAEATFVQHS